MMNITPLVFCTRCKQYLHKGLFKKFYSQSQVTTKWCDPCHGKCGSPEEHQQKVNQNRNSYDENSY